MPAGAVVDLDTRDLQRRLKEFRARGRDLGPTMAIIAEDMVARVSDQFETAGDGEWPPLAESTLRKRRGTTAQILKDTGRFAGSINPFHGPDFAEASTDVSYAVFHVSAAPRSLIPLRNPFDIIDDEFMSTTAETIIEHIVGDFAA